jgi:hypothetical protein
MPKVLVASALIWLNAVRLCCAFREVGFAARRLARFLGREARAAKMSREKAPASRGQIAAKRMP